MKLGELRAAIRKSKAAPSIQASIGGSAVMLLLLQKGAILDALEMAFPGGKAVETGLEFDDASGLISGPPILEAIAVATRPNILDEPPRDPVIVLELVEESKPPVALILDI